MVRFSNVTHKAIQFLKLGVLAARRVSEEPNVAFYSVKERYLRWTFAKQLALNQQASYLAGVV